MNSTKKVFTCSKCSQGFAQRAHLEVHFRVHTKEKPFKCEHCPKAFAQVTNLRNHVMIHTGEKNFECTICYKKFRQVTTLNNHMKLHRGEKPYECPLCSKKFRQASGLNDHAKSNHKNYSKSTSNSEITKTNLFTVKTKKKSKIQPHFAETKQSQEQPVQARKKNLPVSSTLTETPKNIMQISQDRIQNSQNKEISAQGPPNFSKEIPMRMSEMPKMRMQINEEKPIQDSEIMTTTKSSNTEKWIPYWYRCRVCHVCIVDKDVFFAHMQENHPQLERYKPSSRMATSVTTFKQEY